MIFMVGVTETGAYGSTRKFSMYGKQADLFGIYGLAH